MLNAKQVVKILKNVPGTWKVICAAKLPGKNNYSLSPPIEDVKWDKEKKTIAFIVPLQMAVQPKDKIVAPKEALWLPGKD